jgi:hypothetical protein
MNACASRETGPSGTMGGRSAAAVAFLERACKEEPWFEDRPHPAQRARAIVEMAEDYWRGGLGHGLAINDSRASDKRFDEELWDEKRFRFLWWGKLDETTIGCAKTELIDDPVSETQGDIGDFYIAPPFRRKGHGKAFARLLFEWFAG